MDVDVDMLCTSSIYNICTITANLGPCGGHTVKPYGDRTVFSRFPSGSLQTNHLTDPGKNMGTNRSPQKWYGTTVLWQYHTSQSH